MSKHRANLRRGTGAAWLALAVVFWSGGAVADPVVPGAAVTVYATVTDPITRLHLVDCQEQIKESLDRLVPRPAAGGAAGLGRGGRGGVR